MKRSDYRQRICFIALAIVFTVISCCSSALSEDSVAWENYCRTHSFPISGSMEYDMTPLAEYLTLLEENGILFNIQELNVYNNERFSSANAEIGDLLRIIYTVNTDGSGYGITMETPHIYRPKDRAFVILVSYMASLSMEEAETIYTTLQYNVIDNYCGIEKGNCVITYFEPRYSNGELAAFASMSVDKTLE